jgi:hypothetical protein
VTRISLVAALVGFCAGLAAAFWAAALTASFTMLTGVDLTVTGYRLLILLPLGGMIAAGLCSVAGVFLFVVLYNLVAGLFGGIEVEFEEARVPQTKSRNEAFRSAEPGSTPIVQHGPGCPDPPGDTPELS